MDEDDSIATVMNSESSVAKVGFFGPSYEYLYCNTHIESLYIWNAVEVWFPYGCSRSWRFRTESALSTWRCLAMPRADVSGS